MQKNRKIQEISIPHTSKKIQPGEILKLFFPKMLPPCSTNFCNHFCVPFTFLWDVFFALTAGDMNRSEYLKIWSNIFF